MASRRLLARSQLTFKPQGPTAGWTVPGADGHQPDQPRTEAEKGQTDRGVGRESVRVGTDQGWTREGVGAGECPGQRRVSPGPWGSNRGRCPLAHAEQEAAADQTAGLCGSPGMKSILTWRPQQGLTPPAKGTESPPRPRPCVLADARRRASSHPQACPGATVWLGDQQSRSVRGQALSQRLSSAAATRKQPWTVCSDGVQLAQPRRLQSTSPWAS